MAALNFYVLVCVLAVSSYGSCQTITCFDCDPRREADECIDPLNRNPATKPCVPDLDVVNGTSICVSAFLRFSGNKANESGIHRGCQTLRPDVSNFCDWFVEENRSENLTIPTCVACNTTRCNTVRFKDDGSNGAESFTTATFILTFNAVFVLLIKLFE